MSFEKWSEIDFRDGKFWPEIERHVRACYLELERLTAENARLEKLVLAGQYAQTQLEAWMEVFGTSQLTHAKDRLDAAEKLNTRPTPDTGIGQGEAVKLAIEKLEAWKAWTIDTPQGEDELGRPEPDYNEHEIKILEALAALKASSAPALKQEACGECGGSGEVSDGGHKDLEMMVTCESCGGSGKETK